MKKSAVGLCLVVLASLCAAPAGATLIGDEVMVNYNALGDGISVGPESINPVQAGDGDVLDLVINFGLIMRVNVEESSIILTLLQGTGGGGIQFGAPITLAFLDLDWIGTPGIITAVNIVDSTINSNGSLAVGFTNGATGSDINLTLNGSFWDVGQGLTLDIEATHDVPEPTTMALLATGAAGLIAKRRRVVC